MVVEDEPDIYDVLLAMFEIWGIEGVAFVDGAEAVAWIENVDQGRVRGELPELAILDIRLPEAGIDTQEIDLIIVATTTPDLIFPSTACIPSLYSGNMWFCVRPTGHSSY